MDRIECRACRGEMVWARLSFGSCFPKVFAFALGFILAGPLFLTFIGPILGIPLMLASPFVGNSSRKVLRCTVCGCIFDRA